MDWSNVVLGGGAVLSILTGKSEDAAHKNSDVDLFLFGLQPDEVGLVPFDRRTSLRSSLTRVCHECRAPQLIPKVNSLIQQIQAALPPKPKLTEIVSERSKEDGTYRTREIEVDETSKEWRYDHQFDWDSQYRGELLIVKGASKLGPLAYRPRTYCTDG